MNKKIIYALVLLALVFFLTSLLIFLKSGEETPTETLKPANSQESTTGNIEKKVLSVKTFFFSEDSRLMLPTKQVELPTSPIEEDNYKAFINLLLQGEENYIRPVPDGIQLRTLFLIKKKNLLVLDFDENLVTDFPPGTESELEFIYFFVNNICYNFPEIKSVKFMISGNETRTISGHLDIENPFYPDFSYLKEE